MLLAEALAERRQVLDRIAKVGDRWVRVGTWDEDEAAPTQAEADASVVELSADLDRLQDLNVRIHRANNVAEVELRGGSVTVMEAIALRDRLNLERLTLEAAKREIEEAIGARRGRWLGSRRSREDVKTSTLIDPRELGRRADAVAARIRELDLAVQKINWSHRLPE
ncbi:MAG: DIP1984 family protein [Candidatus Limnocylindria bacterium]